jgi:hypothetical protein
MSFEQAVVTPAILTNAALQAPEKASKCTLMQSAKSELTQCFAASREHA